MKYLTTILLIGFIIVGLFSFTTTMSGTNGHPSDGCPFSAMSASLCPQNTVAMVLHHIATYQTFINIPIPVNFGVWTMLVATVSLSLLKLPDRVGIFYKFSPDPTNKIKITRWLALHETSPTIFV